MKRAKNRILGALVTMTIALGGCGPEDPDPPTPIEGCVQDCMSGDPNATRQRCEAECAGGGAEAEGGGSR